MSITNLIKMVPQVSDLSFQDALDHGGPLLTVLSYGAGQDSHTLLLKYIHDPGFRNAYAPNHFKVIMSDTGNEFDETYHTVEHARKLCQQHGIDFTFITSDMGYHTGEWQSLPAFYEAKSAIGSVCYPKICTQRLKIGPIYSYLEDFLSEKYGVRHGKKSGFRSFAKRYGKIRMLIGIADGEQKRMSSAAENKARWYRESVEHSYPLVELRYNRQACQDYIRSMGEKVPIPSNCKMCPYLAPQELEYLRRFEPDSLSQWVGYEQAKLHKFRHLDSVEITNRHGKTTIENKNYGVFGKIYLPEMIEKVKREYASWSDAQIRDYRNSHGHCVASVY